MAQIVEDRISVNGLTSPVLGNAPGSACAAADEAIVFLHGNPGSGQDWQALAQEAAGFARVVAPDMPGFGRADKPHDFDYTVDGYAAHLDHLLNRLGVQRAHLVLHDFGGPWGLAWAARHPDRLASLTLIDTGVMPGYRWHSMARIWRTPLVGELSMLLQTRSAFGLALTHGTPRGLPSSFIDRMYRDLDRGTQRAILRLYRATDDPSGMSERLLPALRPLNPPTLVLWGARDPYLPVTLAHAQREVFPKARVVTLTDSGHWPFADDPKAVASHVLPFLKEQISHAAPPVRYAAC